MDLHCCFVPNWVPVMICAIDNLSKVLEVGTLMHLTHLPYGNYCIQDMLCDLSLCGCNNLIMLPRFEMLLHVLRDYATGCM